MIRAYEEIVDFIAAGTTADEVARFQASSATKDEVERLLAKEKTSGLTPDEASELDHYLQLEHVVEAPGILSEPVRQSTGSFQIG